MTQPRGRRRLGIEMALMFFVLPIGFWQARELALSNQIRLPIIPAVLLLGVVCWMWLRSQTDFDRRQLWRWPRDGALWRRILLRFAVAAVLLTGLTLWLCPEQLLAFPRQRPGLWLLVMVGYPLASVLPQELAYRAFFLHRYAPFLGSPRLRLLLSAVAFGHVHIVFGHPLSILLSALGGLLFGDSYLRTRSIWAAWAEHALYGCFVFTIGLGTYFYGGSALRTD